MPLYMILSPPTAEGLRHLHQNPDRLDEVRREIEAVDAKVVHRDALPGNLSFLTVVDAPNNLGAFRLAVERQSTGRVHIWPRSTWIFLFGYAVSAPASVAKLEPRDRAARGTTGLQSATA